MHEIVCKDIEVTYVLKNKQHVDALTGLSITFKSGTINVVFGENGCGKTTLLNCITGLIGYDGQILFDNVDAKDLSIKDRKISFVQQNHVLQPKLTVFENIVFPLKNQKVSVEDQIKRGYEILERFKMSYLMNCLPKQISIGQQQKVCLAKALISNPNLIILDEAFSNIDPETTLFLQSIIKEYQQTNDCIVIYISHSIEDAIHFGDYFYVMNSSEVTFEGNKEQISQRNLVELLENVKK